MPHNGDKKIIMNFLRINMMPFHTINLKSIITSLLRIPLQLATSTFIVLLLGSRFHKKDYLNFI